MRSLHPMCLPVLGIALSAIAFGSGCSDDKSPVDPGPTTGSVMIQLEHKVGAADLELGNIQYTNAFGNEYGVWGLKYILSNFVIMNDTARIDVDQVHYVDVEDEGTLAIMIDGIPPDHYHMLGITWGLDEEHNVTGALDDLQDPDVDSFFWPEPMGGGYHYMKLEGRYLDGEGSEKQFLTHAGRFKNAERNEPHFVDETFTLHQNIVAGETLVLTLQMNINHWYEGPNVVDLATHDTIMANKQRQDELEQNCGDVFTLLGGGSHGRP